MNFRQAVRQAARDAFKDGEITRLQLMRINIASRRPRIMAEFEEEAFEVGTVCGAIPQQSERASFDWSGLLAFIRELLPLLKEILSLF